MYVLTNQEEAVTTLERKVLVIVLDGVGVGELPDAGAYGDRGSNTLAHIADAVGGLSLPNLATMGLGNILAVEGVPPSAEPAASYGKMACLSKGKDSTTGHWELGGLVVGEEFPTYPHGFPSSLIERFKRATGVRGVLGNVPASGTVIIQELGDEHVRTGFPIVYTSADSVFQIAAHEAIIPLERLYAMCETTRRDVCVGRHEVGRVIARPFIGSSGSFVRTPRRRDFSLPPKGETLLDVAVAHGVTTIGVGKIEDLFAGRGLSRVLHQENNARGIENILRESSGLRHGILFANLVDFDMLYGHRNDPAGFAGSLREFDAALPGILATLQEGDVLAITADHGNDPVGPGTDHTREYVPILWYARGRTGRALGRRRSFADLAKTIADLFGFENRLSGESFLSLTLA
ncbi:MAG TPA: phosphopentomutase [Bacteroidota bacterium]|nr:phosphopentomutase [Bacteroidota bacterium]